ncbi:threonylcarbamoyl-AMP synthase [Episyrphus balteatus]|uniref:threonylcarbamoyl-AMP synthase n=1 Tax=Episyrphus balteatus TaxID=286459 RepID=UPI0024857E8A|nr:threonylcarbamoyl-AMP synthase [Episyrphus balteatus]
MTSIKNINFNKFSNYYKQFHHFAGKMVEKIYQTSLTAALDSAKHCLDKGDVIALPTDTVYGLACSANNEKAIQKLYAIKGRDFHKPVAICVKDIESLRHWGQAEHINDVLLEHLLPGPITIVIERSANLNNRFLNPSTSKIGIRIPDFDFIKNLCDKFDQPLALTSANKSAEQSSLNIQEFECLWPHLGGIFDGGQLGVTEECRSASTVIDLSLPGRYKIVREGIALKRTLSIMESFNIKPLL